jgi:hypothetical protein
MRRVADRRNSVRAWNEPLRRDVFLRIHRLSRNNTRRNPCSRPRSSPSPRPSSPSPPRPARRPRRPSRACWLRRPARPCTRSTRTTLYTFDKDAANSGKSTCNGPCATAWPPLAAQASDAPSGDYTIITRDDGSKQWAYKGQPLYTFSKDAKSGDTTGDNFKNVWHVIKG